MAYLIDISNLLTKTLERFATLNRHQLAGHVANLEFWTSEVRHCLAVLDGYKSRFERMKDAQLRYIKDHQVIQFDLEEPCVRGPASPPTRVNDGEIRETRRQLCEAFYRFLIRCHNESFMSEVTLRDTADSLGIGVEVTDLKR